MANLVIFKTISDQNLETFFLKLDKFLQKYQNNLFDIEGEVIHKAMTTGVLHTFI